VVVGPRSKKIEQRNDERPTLRFLSGYRERDECRTEGCANRSTHSAHYAKSRSQKEN
jgi:predicted RNA-binding Zn ribbon-like protein